MSRQRHVLSNIPLARNFMQAGAFLLGMFFLFSSCKDAPPTEAEPGPVWMSYTAQTSGLVDNAIRAIVADGEGVWFATDSGASRFAKSVWSSYRKELAYETFFGASRKVNALAVGKDGSVWFGLAGGGVRRFNRYKDTGSPWTTYTSPVLSSGVIQSIAVDLTGEVWVGTSAGVNRFLPVPAGPDRDAGIWKQYTPKNSPLPIEPVAAIAMSPYDARLWFGTYTQGFISYDGDSDWILDTPSEKPYPVTSIAFEAGRFAWFGTFGGGACRYTIESGEWMFIGDSLQGGKLPGALVNAVATDKNGTVWFGTNQGLVRLAGDAWTTFTSAGGFLPGDFITALAFDRKDNLWIGTLNGAACYNAGGIRQ